MSKTKLKNVPPSTNPSPPKPESLLTGPQRLRYGGSETVSATIPYSIHAPTSGKQLMSDRAYILINVLPGQTSFVVKALGQIKEIKTIDPCWGKPDIIVVADVRNQDELTKLVYRLKETKAK